MLRVAAVRIRYGYRRLTVLPRREGWKVNTKRVYRHYRREGLAVRTKGRKKRASQVRVPVEKATGMNGNHLGYIIFNYWDDLGSICE
jgi:putative transposase